MLIVESTYTEENNINIIVPVTLAKIMKLYNS